MLYDAAVPLSAIYPPLDLLGQALYLLCCIAMTIRGWWKRFPTFYAIQIVQFGELLWLLYLARTHPSRFYWACMDAFWPNLVAELVCIIMCCISVNRKKLWAVGLAYGVHLEAVYLHYLTTGSKLQTSLGPEFLAKKVLNLGIYFAILWTLYFKCEEPSQEEIMNDQQKKHPPIPQPQDDPTDPPVTPPKTPPVDPPKDGGH